MELWLPIDDVWNMYPQNFTVRMKFSVQRIVEPYAVIVSVTYKTIVELFDECHYPASVPSLNPTFYDGLAG